MKALRTATLCLMAFGCMSLPCAGDGDPPRPGPPAADPGRVLWQVTFDDDPVEQSPATAGYQASRPNTRPQRVLQQGRNTVTVVDELGDMKGKPARLEKGEDTPRLPSIHFGGQKGIVKGGIVRIEWDAVITRYEPGPRFPGFEALLTLNLYNDDGQIFHSLQYLTTDRQARRGLMRGHGLKANEGAWTRGTPHRAAVELDLTQGTASLWIDGKAVMENREVPTLKGQSIRIIEFRDGTAFGAYDGQFTAGLDNFCVTVPR